MQLWQLQLHLRQQFQYLDKMSKMIYGNVRIGTVMTISYDKVIPSKKPEAWKLPVIYGISVVIGVIITIGKCFLVTLPENILTFFSFFL